MNNRQPTPDIPSTDVRARWNKGNRGGGYRANALMLWIAGRC
jgi:hypothetical protein